MPISTTALSIKQIRELDRRTTSSYGIPSLLLMENAGRGVTACVLDLLKKQPKYTHVLVFAGGGNNGGDGFVVARHLFQEKVPVRVYLVSPPDKLQGDAQTNFHIIKKLKIPIRSIDDFATDEETKLKSIPLIVVDAILGTGFKGKLRPSTAKAIERINSLKISHSAKVSVVAVDVPSGIDGDNGPTAAIPVRSDVTVTFVCPKKGLLLPQSKAYTGKCEIIDIGVPHELFEIVKGKKA